MTKLRLLFLGLAAFFAFALLIRADRRAGLSRTVAATAAQSAGAGHWISDTGDVLHLRYDGTGHSRHLHAGVLHECDFEWSCDGALFTVKNFPNVLGSFMAHETGLAIATFPVVEVTDESFVFRHDGIVVTLVPGQGLETPTNGPANGG